MSETQASGKQALIELLEASPVDYDAVLAAVRERHAREGSANKASLELLEAAEIENEAALVDLKQQWAREDAITDAAREAVLEAHKQGARDRDAMRMKLGGASKIEAEKRAAEAREAAARKAEDNAMQVVQSSASTASAGQTKT